MQRRAVAVYVAFFVLIAAASYTLAATAEEPTITLEDADYELSAGETFTVGGQEYTVTEIDETDDDDGEMTVTGTIEWVQQDVEVTETWADGDTVEIDGTTWEIQTDGDAEEPTSVTLQEVRDRAAILEADPAASNETVEQDGEEFVVVDDELVPAAEYFGEPATLTLGQGASFVYNDQTATVTAVTGSDLTISWTEDQTNSDDLLHGEMTELADGNEYLTFFPGQSTVLLTQDTSSYDAQIESQEQFADRMTGFRYTIFTTLFFAFSLIAFAFLPSRY